MSLLQHLFIHLVPAVCTSRTIPVDVEHRKRFLQVRNLLFREPRRRICGFLCYFTHCFRSLLCERDCSLYIYIYYISTVVAIDKQLFNAAGREVLCLKQNPELFHLTI